MEKPVLCDREGPVTLLTLNRPGRHNSLVPEFVREILVAVEHVAEDPEVRAVVLQANGRSFSTGGDVRGFCDHLDDLEAYGDQLVGLLNRVILAMVRLPVPIVAAVHGIVTGGSLGLVLGCDVVLVVPEASFAPYYSVVGFSPDGGWTAMLPDVVGPKRAADVLLRNLTITAEQAVAWGLATRLVPAERIRQEALCVAEGIAVQKAGSIRHTKRLLSRSSLDLAARLDTERIRFVEQIGTEEARRGMIRFLEERSR